MMFRIIRNSFKLAWVLIFLGTPLTASQVIEDNCFSIVVGKDVSTDGSVLMAHNEDDSPAQVVNHYKIDRQVYPEGTRVTLNNGGQLAQADTTWSYIHSEMPGFLFSDSYLNEWGVTICSDACPSREDEPELTEGGINWNLRRLVAQRAKTAREGVKLAGALIESFGYDASGRTYIICDPDEGWLLSVVNGKHWLAKRVPDDEVALIANTYTIGLIDLSDTVNYLSSDDIVSYAVSRGWYDPVREDRFDFAKAYADPGAAEHPTNIGRLWSAVNLVAAQPPVYGVQLPFSVVPKKKMSPADVMAILRDHYESTELFEADENGNPHKRSFQPICRHDTQTSFVAQLRRGDNPDLDLVYWCCVGSPCTSVYLPFYFGLNQFPAGYVNSDPVPDETYYQAQLKESLLSDPENIFWNFSRVRSLIEADYTNLAPLLREQLGQLESEAMRQQALIEKAAAEQYALDPELGAAMLESLSFGLYRSAIKVTVEMFGNTATGARGSIE